MNDDRWKKEVLEAEEWEESIKFIPSDHNLQERFSDLLFKLGSDRRIRLLKLLDQYDYKIDLCEGLLKILLLVSDVFDSFTCLIDLILEYSSHVQTILLFLLNFDTNLLMKFINEYNNEEIAQIFTICRFVSTEELKLMTGYMKELSLRNFYVILTVCNEKNADKCRLCRLKRLEILEFKLNHGGVPSDKLPLVETLDINSDWKSSSSYSFKYFHEDDETGMQPKIYYNNQPIDFMIICNPCLVEVHKVITHPGRNVEYFHLQPKQRIDVLQSLRDNERNMAKLIESVSIERVRRRAHELCLGMLSKTRKGLLIEEKERLNQENAMKKVEEARMKEIERANLNSESSKHWGKWREEDGRSALRHAAVQQSLASLNYHIPFGHQQTLHASSTREHCHSWKLQHFDHSSSESGIGNVLIPISATGASAVFGTSPMLPDIKMNELSRWKSDAIDSWRLFEANNEEKQRRAAIDRREQYMNQLSYVDERLQVIEMRQYKKQKEKNLVEEIRLEKRKQEKAERVAARIMASESRETSLMLLEDDMSRLYKLYLAEKSREITETARMQSEEANQRSRNDSFWGVDYAEWTRSEDERKRRLLYEDLVEQWRVTCVKVQIIRPSEKEARNRVFRDRLTGEPLK